MATSKNVRRSVKCLSSAKVIVFVKDQADASQNGIWVVANSGAWTRGDSKTNASVTPEMEDSDD
jgi:hypothetical protein